ncbi:unnamed protein product [Musa acuminata subsp. malaccensis]|uniref:(wild Malaysian banana) hypothetical protein n=1 Tax=Musa acuminata subsp. malaccensis TaxID=214687 RepID=A0A8D7FCG6_MUSAM|nr:unnamed protein product [Musa acuminata subsp. malaccensis]
MFQSSRKTMKWSSLPKDLREKVGLSGSQPQPASYLFPSLSLAAENGGAAGAPESATALGYGSPVSSPARLVEVHKLSFVVGRAFVTDVEKLRIYSKGNSLNVTDKIKLFIEVKDGIGHGSNLLHAVEVLVTGAIDNQPLLDSGILCCLIHILSVLLNPDKSKGEQMDTLEESNESENRMDDKALQVRQLEVN